MRRALLFWLLLFVTLPIVATVAGVQSSDSGLSVDNLATLPIAAGFLGGLIKGIGKAIGGVAGVVTKVAGVIPGVGSVVAAGAGAISSILQGGSVKTTTPSATAGGTPTTTYIGTVPTTQPAVQQASLLGGLENLKLFGIPIVPVALVTLAVTWLVGRRRKG